jgi:hypothetical protein
MENRVLISGDREWSNREIIRAWLSKLSDFGFTHLIEGEARGADTIAREEAELQGFKIVNRDENTKGFPALWDKYHKAAGPIRNSEMLTAGKPLLVLAFHNNLAKSKGTKDMVNKSVAAGITTIIITERGSTWAKE